MRKVLQKTQYRKKILSLYLTNRFLQIKIEIHMKFMEQATSSSPFFSD